MHRIRAATTSIAVLSCLGPGLAVAGTTRAASVDPSGIPGRAESLFPSISADGRYAAFWSAADNLVPGDTNGVPDIFVRDLETGQTTRVSVATGGEQADRGSLSASISRDGRFVVFASDATNLVSRGSQIPGGGRIQGDRNGAPDIFVHDRKTGETTRVSVSSTGAEANAASFGGSISDDGRHVVFMSYASNLIPYDLNGVVDIFLHDRWTGRTIRISESWNRSDADNWSADPSISADGRFVAFASRATNLVRDDFNGCQDVFLRDRDPDGNGAFEEWNAVTALLSLSTAGLQGDRASFSPRISADGRSIAFASDATNLFPWDTNGVTDVFLRDRGTDMTHRISISSSPAREQGNDASRSPSISPDGRYVAFESWATNLVPGTVGVRPHIYWHDRERVRTLRASVGTTGSPANGRSAGCALSGDGKVVAFANEAGDLVRGDRNLAFDVFVHEPYPILAGDGSPVPGTTLPLRLDAPGAPLLPYVMGASLGYEGGILCGARWVPLDPDHLLAASLVTPSIFDRFVGTLDAGGQATAFIHVPRAPELSGCRFYVAFVTIAAGAPFRVLDISNALLLTIGG